LRAIILRAIILRAIILRVVMRLPSYLVNRVLANTV
jgi:hypothetical protein